MIGCDCGDEVSRKDSEEEDTKTCKKKQKRCRRHITYADQEIANSLSAATSKNCTPSSAGRPPPVAVQPLHARYISSLTPSSHILYIPHAHIPQCDALYSPTPITGKNPCDMGQNTGGLVPPGDTTVYITETSYVTFVPTATVGVAVGKRVGATPLGRWQDMAWSPEFYGVGK